MLVAKTTLGDWSELPGPTHIYSIGDGSENGAWRLFLDAHYGRAVLRNHLDVGLAWGMTWNDEFEEPWTQHFPDKSATGHYADILWRGSLVSRESYVTVDGGRYAIPLPRQDFEEIMPGEHALMPYTISSWQYAFGKIIHGLSAGHPYDEGLRRARVEIES